MWKKGYNEGYERGGNMAGFVFMRQEQKYLLQPSQREELEKILAQRLKPDVYAVSKVCNIYYDTPDCRMIRRSLDKPVYKEKLRLRSYGDPSPDSTVYLELKKKYDGMVYKRRISMGYTQALAYMADPTAHLDKGQIGREIDYARHFYPDLRPSVYLSYDRKAWQDPGSDLRVTIDWDIRYRFEELDLARGSYGSALLEPGMSLLEIKAERAMPLWLSHFLSREKIRPLFYSKYGNAYLRHCRQNLRKEGISYA